MGIVLLTSGEPQLRVDNMKRRLSRWLGITFTEGKDDAENFIVGNEHMYMVKLAHEFLFMISLLKRPYWESEDIEPYLNQLSDEDVQLAKALRACRGAILIDVHITIGPQACLYLAKLAAAAMEPDTPVMVVPLAMKSTLVTDEARSAMGRATKPPELLPHLANVLVGQARTGTGVLCTTWGLDLFGLPNVGMICQENEVERAAAAVQSAVTYQVSRGKAVPPGDTMTVERIGEVRVAAPPKEYQVEGVPFVFLEWM